MHAPANKCNKHKQPIEMIILYIPIADKYKY